MSRRARSQSGPKQDSVLDPGVRGAKRCDRPCFSISGRFEVESLRTGNLKGDCTAVAPKRCVLFDLDGFGRIATSVRRKILRQHAELGRTWFSTPFMADFLLVVRCREISNRIQHGAFGHRPSPLPFPQAGRRNMNPRAPSVLLVDDDSAVRNSLCPLFASARLPILRSVLTGEFTP